MQQEALNRLREMQSRSKSIIGQPAAEEPQINPPESSAVENQDVRRRQAPHNRQPTPVHNTGIQDIFKSILGDGFSLDSEKALILIMLYVLYKNKADIKLILALGYLLL